MIKKTILMLLNQRFLPDPRVEQQYEALTKEGYRVIVVADENGQDKDGYEIIRVNPNKGISAKYNLTLKLNPILKKEILDALNFRGIKKVDAIHVHDLFWSFLGVELRSYYGAKLIIDLHENYPAMMEDFGAVPRKRTLKQYAYIVYKSINNPLNGPVWKILKEHAHSPKRLRKYERKMLEKTDAFIVVVDEALMRFRNMPFCSKGTVVSNTKDPDVWRYEQLKPIDGKLVITYMGTIQDLRGLDTAILAMNHVDQAKFELNIVGIKNGDGMHRKFLSIINQYDIKNVNLIDWLSDEKKAYKYINDAHVCIVPHKNTELTQTTIPHKLFMYMATGRPVLVSDVAPLKRIVSASNNGLVFKAENAIDLAEKMKVLYNDELLAEFSRNGRSAIEETFNWEHDKNRLIALYAKLLQ